MAVFQDYIIAVEFGFSVRFKKKQEIRKLVTKNGGILSYIINKKCTCLVVTDTDKVEDSHKSKTAQKYGIPVVSVDYLYSCVQQNRRLDFDEFVLVGKTRAKEFGCGKIVAPQLAKGKEKRLTSKLDMNKVKVWQHGDSDAPVYNEESYEIAKYAILKKTHKDTSKSDFCVIEIHVDSSAECGLSKTRPHCYRIFTHTGSQDHSVTGDVGVKQCRFVNTSSDALSVYENLFKQFQSAGYIKDKKTLPASIGSEKLMKIRREFGAECEEMPPGVARLVEHLWQETMGQLEEMLAVSVENVKLEQVEKAEGVLLQIRRALEKNEQSSEVQSLSAEFYTCIPHTSTCNAEINSKAEICRKQDLCQLIRDMNAVSESTNWSPRSSVQSKYRALRCNISELHELSKEYKDVRDLVTNSQMKGRESVSIKNVFTVQRSIEELQFQKEVGNIKQLFHASAPGNFIGILSRGLLLPRVVVDDMGGSRTDAGMLGSGIYFSDSSSTSVKYSSAGSTVGTRFMLVNQVCLGKCKQVYSYDTSLTAPPYGYNSVHGVRKTEQVDSQFQDDEFAVYSTSQQKIQYLVEFTLPGDKIKHFQPSLFQTEDTEQSIDFIDIDDVKDIPNPMNKVQPGLLSKSDAAVPLKSVHVRARLLDLSAEVKVMQAYTNESDAAIEAKYVFPLDDMAAVCGFEAYINGKHIIGEVKEKETAHKEYKKAISEGHGAYLMDQDEETPDVFTVSVGNLPPKATVLIKITYVAELQVEGENICFNLPSSVAPWKKKSALSEVTQTDVDTVKVEKDMGETTIQVSVEMPFDIRSIECPTQKIKIKKTAAKAVVEMEKDQDISDGFRLLIGLAEIHVPRMWVEEHPDKRDHQACMLTFYPEFEAEELPDNEVVFMLDLSNSMKGSSLCDAKKILLLALRLLSQKSFFNIVVFGTGYDELFPSCRLKSNASVKAAEDYVQSLSASMGNTEVHSPLHSYFLLSPENSLRNIILISDGHLNNAESSLQAIRINAEHTRVFTCGVSASANRHLLRSIARVGAGAFEFFDSKTKSKWQEKIWSQLSRASQPGLTSVTVEWRQFTEESPLQAPNQITSLFTGSRQVVYGFVPNCTMATLKAEIGGKEVSTVVSTSDLNITKGKILHTLTARAIIVDWEEGSLDPDRTEHEVLKMDRKSCIIDLSKEYSIVTQFTSFVAIEKRDKDEAIDEGAPGIADLVSLEGVDILSYIGWEEEEKAAPVPVVNVEDEIRSLLDMGMRMESCAVNSAQDAYERALKVSSSLSASHPLVLKVVNCYAEFCNNVLSENEKAYAVASLAYSNAINDTVISAESNSLLSKLNDNMRRWSLEEEIGHLEEDVYDDTEEFIDFGYIVLGGRAGGGGGGGGKVIRDRRRSSSSSGADWTLEELSDYEEEGKSKSGSRSRSSERNLKTKGLSMPTKRFDRLAMRTDDFDLEEDYVEVQAVHYSAWLAGGEAEESDDDMAFGLFDDSVAPPISEAISKPVSFLGSRMKSRAKLLSDVRMMAAPASIPPKSPEPEWTEVKKIVKEEIQPRARGARTRQTARISTPSYEERSSEEKKKELSLEDFCDFMNAPPSPPQDAPVVLSKKKKKALPDAWASVTDHVPSPSPPPEISDSLAREEKASSPQILAKSALYEPIFYGCEDTVPSPTPYLAADTVSKLPPSPSSPPLPPPPRLSQRDALFCQAKLGSAAPRIKRFMDKSLQFGGEPPPASGATPGSFSFGQARQKESVTFGMKSKEAMPSFAQLAADVAEQASGFIPAPTPPQMVSFGAGPTTASGATPGSFSFGQARQKESSISWKVAEPASGFIPSRLADTAPAAVPPPSPPPPPTPPQIGAGFGGVPPPASVATPGSFSYGQARQKEPVTFGMKSKEAMPSFEQLAGLTNIQCADTAPAAVPSPPPNFGGSLFGSKSKERARSSAYARIRCGTAFIEPPVLRDTLSHSELIEESAFSLDSADRRSAPSGGAIFAKTASSPKRSLLKGSADSAVPRDQQQSSVGGFAPPPPLPPRAPTSAPPPPLPPRAPPSAPPPPLPPRAPTSAPPPPPPPPAPTSAPLPPPLHAAPQPVPERATLHSGFGSSSVPVTSIYPQSAELNLYDPTIDSDSLQDYKEKSSKPRPVPKPGKHGKSTRPVSSSPSYSPTSPAYTSASLSLPPTEFFLISELPSSAPKLPFKKSKTHGGLKEELVTLYKHVRTHKKTKAVALKALDVDEHDELMKTASEQGHWIEFEQLDDKAPDEDGLTHIASKDVSGYDSGISTPVPPVVTHEPVFSSVTMELLAGLQNKEGFWELNGDLDLNTGVNSSQVETILFDAGLRSLGQAAVTDISRMLATMLVLARIFQYYAPDLLKETVRCHFTGSKPDSAMLQLCPMLTEDYSIDYLSAWKYIEITDRKYPLIYFTLELGSNWIEVIYKMLGLSLFS